MNQDHNSSPPLPHQQALLDKFFEEPAYPGHLVLWEPGLGAVWTSAHLINRLLMLKPSSRVLVLSPRALAVQVEHHLSSVGVTAQLVDRFRYRAMQDGARPGDSIWGQGRVFILGLDFAKQDDITTSLCSVPWSLLVVPEAHHLRGQRKRVVRELVNSSPKIRVLLLTMPGVEDIPRLGIKRWTESTMRRTDVVDAAGNRLFELSQPIVRHFEFAQDALEKHLKENVSEVVRLLVPTNRNQKLLGSILDASMHSSLSALEEVLRRLRNRLAHGNFDAFQGIEELDDETDADELPTFTPAENRKLLEALDKCLKELDSVAGDSKLKGLALLLVDGKANRKLPQSMCILTQYRATLFYVQAALEELGFAPHVLHGALPFEERFNAVRAFQEHGGILLATAAVTGGLSMPQVESLVLYDPPRSRLMLQQILGRFQRFGRRAPLTIDVVNSRETMELLTELLSSK